MHNVHLITSGYHYNNNNDGTDTLRTRKGPFLSLHFILHTILNSINTELLRCNIMLIEAKDKLMNAASSAKQSVSDGLNTVFAKQTPGSFTTGVGSHGRKYEELTGGNDPYNKDNTAAGRFPILEYPIGLSDPTSPNAGPMMVITAFKYRRRSEGRLLSTKNTADKASDSVKAEIQFIIRLPLPGGISNSVGSNYSDHDGIGNLISQAATGQGNFGSDWDSAAARIKEIGSDLITRREGETGVGLIARGAGHVVNAATSGDGAMKGGLASIARDNGIAINKNASVTGQYEGPAVMSHAFNFTMLPVSKNESIVIRQIIQLLQEFSTGESQFKSTSLIMDYPSMFNIEFVTNRIKETPGKSKKIGGFPLPKIPFINDTDTTSREVITERIKGVLTVPDCYLENVAAVLNPGLPRIMSDNSPSTYNLSLSFKNIAALTRGDLRTLNSNSDLSGDTSYSYETLEELEELNKRSFIEEVIASSRF